MTSQKKEYSLTWLKLYIQLRLPLAILSGAFTIFGEIIEGSNGSFASSVYTGLLIGEILLFVLYNLVYANMRSMKPLGYTLNTLLIGLECVKAAMNAVLQNVYTGIDGGILILGIAVALLVLSVLWGIPNYIYFSHRKFLFTGEKTVKELGDTACDDRPLNLFLCEKCGYTGGFLVTGQPIICPQCGTSLTDTQISSETWDDLSDVQKEDYRRIWKRPGTKASPPVTKPERPVASPGPSVTRSPVPDPVSASEIRFCTKCGSRIIPGANFCRRCGTAVVKD